MKAKHRMLNMVRVAVWALVFSFVFSPVCLDAQEADSSALPSLRPGKRVTLAQALHRADERNRSLEALRVNLALAAQNMRASWAGLLPTVSGELGYVLHDEALTSTDSSGRSFETRERNEVDATLNVRMPLVNAQTWLGVDVAGNEEEIAKLSMEQARQVLLYTVAETYYQAATAQELIRVYASQADALENHIKDALSRYRSGAGELMDVKSAQTDLISLRESQAGAIFALEDIRDTLALLMVIDTPPLPVENPESVPFEGVSEKQDTTDATANRWDVEVAEKELRLAEKELKTQYMQFVPTLVAVFQYDYALTVPDTPLVVDRDSWFTGLTLTVPLFNYGFYPALGSKRESKRKARLELEDVKAEAETEYLHSLRMIREAEYFVGTAKTKTKLADDTLKLARIAYFNGNATALTVIDARRSSQNAHVDFETRRLELELARLAYLRAIGKDVTELFGRP